MYVNHPKKTLKWILQQAKGDCADRVHSDQRVLWTVSREAWPHERWPKAFKTKLAQGGAIRLESTQIRWFLWWPAGRLYLVRGSQRCSRKSWKISLESQGTYSGNWPSDSLKKFLLPLSQGKKMKGDEAADDEDYDAMRTSMPQDRMTATLCSEELFLSIQFI